MTLSPERLQMAMHSLAVDKVSAEVIAVLEARGIDVLMVKGPVIAEWLYPNDVRPYGDGDLVVAQADWDRAVATLEEMGFRDFLGPLEHPRMESQAGTGFARDGYSVDLHSTLPGLVGDPAEVWRVLNAAARTLPIGGRQVRVPDHAAVLLHVGLHAVHHVEGKPLEDLRRAVAIASDDEWRQAADLAGALGGLEAFASGLSLLPEADAVAVRLGLQRAGSVHFDLRTSQVPLAEGLHGLVSATGRGRLRILISELFPNADFMRWAMPTAQRGRVGLVASYPLRWVWLLRKLPAAAKVVYRTERRHKIG